MGSTAESEAAQTSPGLSPEHIAIVKSTAPVLAEHGLTITTHFYKNLLSSCPHFKNVFNSGHQATGTQQAALAHAVWAYAANIDNLGALGPAVSRISHKHASMAVAPEHYPIVGKYLLESIKAVLGDAATQPILDAWEAAYGQLAEVFISTEKDLYKSMTEAKGGWTGWRKFKVARKVPESDEITSFYFEPIDGKPLPTYEPGQYISIRLYIPELGLYQPRQYSLSQSANQSHFRISVKREAATYDKPAGCMSNFLHREVSQGEEVELSHPRGDFTLDVTTDKPVVLISGGVGITPMLAMLGQLTEDAKQRKVLFVHATRGGKVHAMKDYVNKTRSQNPQVGKAVFYENVGEHDVREIDYDYEGRLDLEKIRDRVLLPDADYYLCGPSGFMQAQQKKLESMGVPSARIHSEVFNAGTL
jgi:nitric oxide dioxygenase